MKKYVLIFTVLLSGVAAVAQEGGIRFGLFDGIVMAGYAGKGGFLNFAGPNLAYTSGNSRIMIGMLPSLRFKEDRSAVKNAFVTPNLGMGITFVYKKAAVQIPLYYNSKTASLNGKWVVGVGVGMKLR